jgi:hypothetical protein
VGSGLRILPVEEARRECVGSRVLHLLCLRRREIGIIRERVDEVGKLIMRRGSKMIETIEF